MLNAAHCHSEKDTIATVRLGEHDFASDPNFPYLQCNSSKNIRPTDRNFLKKDLLVKSEVNPPNFFSSLAQTFLLFTSGRLGHFKINAFFHVFQTLKLNSINWKMKKNQVW
jgi:hypothetical protein